MFLDVKGEKTRGIGLIGNDFRKAKTPYQTTSGAKEDRGRRRQQPRRSQVGLGCDKLSWLSCRTLASSKGFLKLMGEEVMDFSLLSKVDSPADIKKLDRQQLGQLADELRSFMIHTISKTGGHLASSLGTVELTVALHYVFNAPEDQLVWDVGHQAYGHKILTGRRDQFHTLRQYEGISGFPRREESVYDAFNVAHASTSISAALGMAVARDLARKDFHVVAIIGDGGLTGGIALEGINQAGHLQKKLLIILNDNEMSISPNVGAIAGYLNRIVTGQVYNRFKKEVEVMLLSVPHIGKRLLKIAKDMVDAMKTFMVPGLLFPRAWIRLCWPHQWAPSGHLGRDPRKTETQFSADDSSYCHEERERLVGRRIRSYQVPRPHRLRSEDRRFLSHSSSAAVVHIGIRKDHDQAGAAGSEDRGHHRSHAGRNRVGAVQQGVPRPLF